jgi:pyruvate formate lyase activating enzyme
MATPESARFGGVVPFSSCDWPGKLAATVFLAGCPWRCGYCHNPHLLSRRSGERNWPALQRLLAQRHGLLDGVVFSGGEPLAEPALPALIDAVREMGFKVGLHTGGGYPDRLAPLLDRLDWVGFDVKTMWSGYADITGIAGSGERARLSLARLVDAGIELEARSTLHPHWHNETTLAAMAEQLREAGVRHWVWQRARTTPGTLKPLAPLPSDWPPPRLAERLGRGFAALTIRAQ